MTDALPVRQPYGWAIEYPSSGAQDTRVAFLLHDDRIDLAAAEQRAADLHGVLVTLIADRRKE